MSKLKSNKPEWSHVPDKVIENAITASLDRATYDQLWEHLAGCEVCRDRYWDNIQKMEKSKKELAKAFVNVANAAFTIGMPASLKKLLTESEEEATTTLEDAATTMLSKAEKLNEGDALTMENLGVEKSVGFEHVRVCEKCRDKLLEFIEKRKQDMPHKASLIDRLVAFIKKVSTGDDPEKSTEHKAGGEPRFFAN